MSELTPTPGAGLIALAAEKARVSALAIEAAEADGGEIPAQLDAYLNEIETKLRDKPDSYKFVMDGLKNEAEMLWAKAEEFERAALMLEGIEAQMKQRIRTAMEVMRVTELTGQTWKFSLRKTKTRLEIDADYKDKLPAELLIVKTVYEPDKERIRAVLESGKEVPGAALAGGTALYTGIVKRTS